jgi:hypothetical protein
VIDAWQSASFSVSADPIFKDQVSAFDMHTDAVAGKGNHPVPRLQF